MFLLTLRSIATVFLATGTFFVLGGRMQGAADVVVGVILIVLAEVLETRPTTK